MSIVTAAKAKFLQQTLGTRCAAGYLRNRNVPLETALYWLTGKVGV